MRIAFIALIGVAALAQTSGDLGYTDTPILLGQLYHLHDPVRPHPKVVTPAAQPGGAPSDAMVLFDGKSLSQWTAARLNPVKPQFDPRTSTDARTSELIRITASAFCHHIKKGA
jgi:hypothetical protein